MPDPIGIPSLNAFLDSLQSASHGEYAARAASRVAHEGAFSEMKSHIVQLYEGVEAPHSFVDQSGAIFDCIPIEQQPSLRGSGESVSEAPDLPPIAAAAGGQQGERKESLTGSPLGPDR